jgi:hypothetical protein
MRALRGAHLGDRGRAPVAVPSRIDTDHFGSGPDGHRRSRAATSPALRAVAAVSLNSRHPGFHCTNRRRAHLGPVEPLPKTGGGPGVYDGLSSPFNKPPPPDATVVVCQRGDIVFPLTVSDRFRSCDRVRFAYSVPAAGHLMIFGVDERGEIFPYYGEGSLSSIPVGGDTQTLLPGSIAFEDRRGMERIFDLWAADRRDASQSRGCTGGSSKRQR